MCADLKRTSCKSYKSIISLFSCDAKLHMVNAVGLWQNGHEIEHYNVSYDFFFTFILSDNFFNFHFCLSFQQAMEQWDVYLTYRKGNFVYNHWGSTSIYRPLSYPCISLLSSPIVFNLFNIAFLKNCLRFLSFFAIF